jgi:large subunit ribosomal protein L31
MTKSISTKFYKNATVKCSNCGSVYTLGMALEDITVEICGNCHPLYTGQEILVDTAGRIEKFQARAGKTGGLKKDTDKKPAKGGKARKFKQSIADLISDEEQPKAKKQTSKKQEEKQESPSSKEITE